MRTYLKTLVLAVAVTLTVSTVSLMAADKGDWSKVAVNRVPANVMTGYHKLFSRSKILKAEKSGTGADLRYRLTIQHKGKPRPVLFDAQGHVTKD